jgi:hypothetical protein
MNQEPMPTRRLVFVLLIVIAAGLLAGRILAVERVYEPSIARTAADPESGWSQLWPATKPEPTPTFSSNDRSRWATVRALVDEGHYWIGYREFHSDGTFSDHGFVITESAWFTIDKVLDPKTGKFYSSKPPFLATLIAGEYWLLKHGFRCDIAKRPWPAVLVGLFTVNWLPLLIYFILLARLAERFGATDWGRIFVVAAGCFATMPTLFAITINNHTIAACSALFAICATLQAGGMLSRPVMPKDESESLEGPRKHGTLTDDPNTVGGMLSRPEMAAIEGERAGGPRKLGSPRWLNLVLAGFFAGFAACCEMPATALAVALFVFLLLRAPRQTVLYFLPAALVPVAAFFLTNYLAIGEWFPVQTDTRSAWYQYQGSNFKTDPSKIGASIDRLDESKPVYAFHLLLGHHGLFSLSPIWLLALVGMSISMRQLLRAGPMRVLSHGDERDNAALVGTLAFVLTVVVVVFYVFNTNNYGGWTNGPRWLMWLTPLLLVALLPAADRMAPRRWARAIGYVLLAFSVLSVSYRDWNPWRHPWVYNFLESLGWRPY